MLDNKFVADNLLLVKHLLEVKGEGGQRVSAFGHASNYVRALEAPVAELLANDQLPAIEGVDDRALAQLKQLATAGTSDLLDILMDQIPTGVVQMLELPGLGPNKARVLWQQMGIDDLSQLAYACSENRLVNVRGFGLRTQDKISAALVRQRASEKQFLYSDLLPHAEGMQAYLQEELGTGVQVALTGDMRRKLLLADRIEFLVAPFLYKDIMLLMVRAPEYELITAGADLLQVAVRDTQIHIDFLFKGANFYYDLLQTTGAAGHVAALEADEGMFYTSEEEIYLRAAVQYVPPELREGDAELKLAGQFELPELIEAGDIRGLMGVHSDWSDGRESIAELADAMQLRGYEYLGLSEPLRQVAPADRDQHITALHAEIDRINEVVYPCRVLKGLDADIGSHGELGLEPLMLSRFDYVVASVRDDLFMNEARATNRLLTAIRNPYVSILGHPTGRLLLGRSGYPVDLPRIIEACAEYGVFLELNAHPQRMDLDWRWIRYAVDAGVMICIQLNAYQIADFDRMRPGIAAARKGMLTPELTLNTRNLAEIEEIFMQRRNRRIKSA